MMHYWFYLLAVSAFLVEALIGEGARPITILLNNQPAIPGTIYGKSNLHTAAPIVPSQGRQLLISCQRYHNVAATRNNNYEYPVTEEEDDTFDSGKKEKQQQPCTCSFLNNQSDTKQVEESETTVQTASSAPPISTTNSYLPPQNSSTVWNNLGKLTRLTRPSNFPGICLFHMLGAYLALQDAGRLSHYWQVLLADPTMWLVLSALILTSSTSMVVNDYYDTKLGRDSTRMDRALVRGDIPMYLVRRYVSYLYAASLTVVAFLPGEPARLSVLVALMLTYAYTKHFKPMTWVKNLVCAALIAFSPLTSGSAALFRTVNYGDHYGSLLATLRVPSLWRLVSILFVGFVGREMTMDCNDVREDATTGVLTVPVRFGTKFASRFAFLCSALVGILSTLFPGIDLAKLLLSTAGSSSGVWAKLIAKPRIVGRFALALVGSWMMLHRSWQVYTSQAKNKDVNQRAIEEGMLSVLFILASFV